MLAYRCLVKEEDREAPSFLYESIEPGFEGSSVARGYTLVASSPETLTRVKKVRGCSLTCWDALQAALPVGTICGAPKATL
uniref:Anthranilate synthase alpha 1 n=1 Tax=Solanum tuberosum TaxID=4113 RepID=M1D888_SOLTU